MKIVTAKEGKLTSRYSFFQPADVNHIAQKLHVARNGAAYSAKKVLPQVTGMVAQETTELAWAVGMEYVKTALHLATAGLTIPLIAVADHILRKITGLAAKEIGKNLADTGIEIINQGAKKTIDIGAVATNKMLPVVNRIIGIGSPA
jgi:hypothetical protein